MKYKVGDKVKIKSLEWYNNSQKDEYGSVKHGSGSNVFTNNMTKYAGMEATISKVGTYYYTIEIDGGMWGWNDWMFEECSHSNLNEKEKTEMYFTNIENEKYRVYEFSSGIVRIDNPKMLNVSSSGGHRILDCNGISHYIPNRWNHIYWEAKEGCDKFVK